MREWYEVYRLYIDDQMEEIERGEPVVLEVRDLAMFSRSVVKAKVAKEKEALESAQTLWLRDLKDVMESEPWYIQIVEELPDDAFNPKRRAKREWKRPGA